MHGQPQQVGIPGQTQQSQQQIMQQGNVVLKMTDVQPISSVGKKNIYLSIFYSSDYRNYLPIFQMSNVYSTQYNQKQCIFF